MIRLCPLPEGAPIAVAVSGGGDSMALVLLAAHWAAQTRRALTALTVDHGLRPESRAEADTVGRWLEAHGIAHEILAWTGPKPATGLQEAARAARYRLIGGWARGHGVRHVLLAHQLEDQAETFLMRLARGSGIAGLATMREVIERDGVRFLRPLLGIARARLRATLAAHVQDWIEDPSNESPRFTRTAYRTLVAALAASGVEPSRIARLAQDCARLEAILDGAVRSFLGAAAIRVRGSGIRLDVGMLRAFPEPLALLALRRVLAEVGGRAQQPRSDRLARAYARLFMEADVKPFTLAGCGISVDKTSILVRPEAPRRRIEGFRDRPSAI